MSLYQAPWLAPKLLARACNSYFLFHMWNTGKYAVVLNVINDSKNPDIGMLVMGFLTAKIPVPQAF